MSANQYVVDEQPPCARCVEGDATIRRLHIGLAGMEMKRNALFEEARDAKLEVARLTARWEGLKAWIEPVPELTAGGDVLDKMAELECEP